MRWGSHIGTRQKSFYHGRVTGWVTSPLLPLRRASKLTAMAVWSFAACRRTLFILCRPSSSGPASLCLRYFLDLLQFVDRLGDVPVRRLGQRGVRSPERLVLPFRLEPSG